MISAFRNTVFIDTSFFVAFLNQRDEHHARAEGYFWASNDRLLTTQWVLAETANYFAASKARASAETFLRQLPDDDRWLIQPATSDDYGEGLKLYGRRPDKEWSLTDCISFNVMRREQVTRAQTADHHFEQAGFEILLKPA